MFFQKPFLKLAYAWLFQIIATGLVLTCKGKVLFSSHCCFRICILKNGAELLKNLPSQNYLAVKKSRMHFSYGNYFLPKKHYNPVTNTVTQKAGFCERFLRLETPFGLHLLSLPTGGEK